MSAKTDYTHCPRRQFTLYPQRRDPHLESLSSCRIPAAAGNTISQPHKQPYGSGRLPYHDRSNPRNQPEICLSPTWVRAKKQKRWTKEAKPLGNDDITTQMELTGYGEAILTVNQGPRRLTKKQPLARSRRASIAGSDFSRLSNVCMFLNFPRGVRNSRASLSYDTTEKARRASAEVLSPARVADKPDLDISFPISRLSNASEGFGVSISRGLSAGQGLDLSSKPSLTKDSHKTRGLSNAANITVFPEGLEKGSALQRAGFYKEPTNYFSRSQPNATSEMVTNNSKKEDLRNLPDIELSKLSASSRAVQHNSIKLKADSSKIRGCTPESNHFLESSVGTRPDRPKPPLRRICRMYDARGASERPVEQDLRKQYENGSALSSANSCHAAHSEHYSTAPETWSSSYDRAAPKILQFPIIAPLASTSNVSDCTRHFANDRRLLIGSESAPSGYQDKRTGLGFIHIPAANGIGIKNKQISQQSTPLAKIFVICCRCKFWHDIPSELYAGLAVPENFSRPSGLAPGQDMTGSGKHQNSRHVSHPGSGTTADFPGTVRRTGCMADPGPSSSTSFAAVKCSWCKHNMTRSCCTGWTTIVYLLERHH